MRTRHLVVKQSSATMNAARSLLRSVGVSISKYNWRKEEKWEQLLGHPRIPLWMKPLLVVYRNVWQALDDERRDLDALVGPWSRAAGLKLLCYVRFQATGRWVTLAVLSSLDDPNRFKRPGQVASYAGLVPSTRDSGDSKTTGRHHTSRPSHSAVY